MASLRKASAYSKKIARPFTRKSSRKNRAYIKMVPPNKIVKFAMGNQNDLIKGKHKFAVKFVSEEKIQIRDNALESGRMLINKLMDKYAPGNYFLAVKVYPHHILRENKTAAGAGADRLSSGMKHSYGINIGRAAIVKPGKEIFYISVPDEKSARDARKVLEAVRTKVPCKGRIIFEKI